LFLRLVRNGRTRREMTRWGVCYGGLFKPLQVLEKGGKKKIEREFGESRKKQRMRLKRDGKQKCFSAIGKKKAIRRTFRGEKQEGKKTDMS